MLAVVNVPWLHKGRATTSHEGALYAALDIIGQGNPPLAQAIHDDKGLPPFSAHLDSGLLRIGCLTTDVFLAVAQSQLAYKATLEKEATFDTILSGQPATRTVKLTFLTPTSFASNGQTHVLPETARVFGNLVRRWREMGGPEVPDLRYEEATVIGARIATRPTHLSRYTVYGCTGFVLVSAPADVACWYHALAEFATYSGVGQRTSQGFGRVTIDSDDLRHSRADRLARHAA